MDQTYAVIDIGTLKVKTFVASVSPDDIIIEKYSSTVLTCFGCELEQNNRLVKEEYLSRTLDELKRVKKELAKFDLKHIRVISTHAMRQAKNAQQIKRRIKQETGFEVENISQEEEAELFFQAVMSTFPKNDTKYALMDVGGGSVQVLIGTPERLEECHLIQTGSSLLHDKFISNSNKPDSKTTPEDLERMKQYILDQLILLEAKQNIPLVYGSTNIIDLMEAINLPLDPNPDSKSHPYKTYAKHLELFIQKVLPMSYAEREKKFKFTKGYMWGIDKAFLNVVLLADKLKSPYIIPSNANIAKGIIYSMAK